MSSEIPLALACFALGVLLGYGATTIDAYGRYRAHLRELQQHIRDLEQRRMCD